MKTRVILGARKTLFKKMEWEKPKKGLENNLIQKKHCYTEPFLVLVLSLIFDFLSFISGYRH